MGHEFSGVVSEVGSAASGYEVGDRVTVEPNIPCYDCVYCEEGSYNLCTDAVAIGLQTDSGGFAESAVVPAAQAHHLPSEVTLEQGALVEPLAVGLHAVRQSGLRPGDTVAVFGCGPIGLTVVRAARAAAAQQVFVSEPRDALRELALEVGADRAIDPTEADAVSRIKGGTPDGVDCAFEFAGIEAAFNAAVRSTRRDGTIIVGSISERDVSTDLNTIVTGERTVQGTFCYGYPPLSFRTEFDAIVSEFANGRIDVEPFVTGRIALDDIVERGFEALLDDDQTHVKILVES